MSVTRSFKHRFSFATVLAANVCCNQCKIMPQIFYKPCTPPSEVAVLFYWNLSRCPFFEQIADLDLLLCRQIAVFAQDSTRNMLICSYALLLLRDQWMIERLSKAMSAAALLWFVTNSRDLHQISDSSRLKITRHQNLFNSVSIARVVALFPPSSRSRPAATAPGSETPCVCARPSIPLKLCRTVSSQSAAPRSYASDFCFSLSDLSELRRALICPSRADQL